MIWLLGYFVIAFVVLVLGRAWQHKHPLTSTYGGEERVLGLFFGSLLWPVSLLLATVAAAWALLDSAIRWAVYYKPASKPPRKMVEDPKAGYRDPGAR